MKVGVAVLLIAVWPALAWAQVSTGRIDVRVEDGTGGALAGAAVTVSGPQAQTATTDEQGRAHLLNLASGIYTVRVRLAGFGDYFNPAVEVAAGTSVPLAISMMVQGVVTQVQVTKTVPLVDERKLAIATNLDAADLQNVPSARDPWVVLQTIPGVFVDRVNVGGAESGQQSVYMAKGAAFSDNTWSLDGIPITDMAATGATPGYYDFDSFQEMQVVTGGADVHAATPGVQLNLVLKAGSDAVRGSARGYFEDEHLQANNMPADLAATIGGDSGKGNRIDSYGDYGAELGGPLLKGRVWGWGSLGRTTIDVITLNSDHDRTELQNGAAKITGQLTDALRANFTYFRGDKDKFGRGAAPGRAAETTTDQTGPTSVYKGAADYAARNFFVSAKGAHVDAGFDLTPKAGASENVWQDDSGVFHGSFAVFSTRRPQDFAAVDASTFRGAHELKFGFAWRRNDVTSTNSIPGSGIVTYHVGYPEMLAQITRDSAVEATGAYWSAYAGDTWTLSRITLSAGVRWDRQASSLDAASVPAARTFPLLLPAVTAAPVGDAIVWNAVVPRVGMTWASRGEKQTVVRAAYSMFASQLGAASAGFISPIQPASITFEAFDLNGNKVADAGEIDTGALVGFSGFDPRDPARLTTINEIGTYRAPITHEVIAGVEREMWPHVTLGAEVTFRRTNQLVWAPPIGVTAADYVRTGTLTGSADPIGQFSVPLYSLLLSSLPAGGGRVYEERGGYHQRFLGFEVHGVKRLNQGWTMRGAFSTSDHREYFSGTDGLVDPTPSPIAPARDGGLVVTETAGSGKSNVFMVLPKYQITASGLYQARWGINLAFSLVVRQGYATPYFAGATSTGDLNGQPPTVPELKDVLVVDDVGRFRLPAAKSFDARLEKMFIFGRGTVALDLDVFNVMNSPTVLGRQYDLRLTGPTGFNQVLEIMDPRILRLGVRASF